MADIPNRDCHAAHTRPRQWPHSAAVSAASRPLAVYPRRRHARPARPQTRHGADTGTGAGEGTAGRGTGTGTGRDRGGTAGACITGAGATAARSDGCQAGRPA